MTNSEKELWLCEFHDAFERGDLDLCREMIHSLGCSGDNSEFVQLTRLDGAKFAYRCVELFEDPADRGEYAND